MKPRYKRRGRRLGNYPLFALMVALAVAAFLVPLACITGYLIINYNEAAKRFGADRENIGIVQTIDR